MLQLLFYDYQRTVCCYTIYRTFKRRSSDDFTTILRLFVRRNYDYWLRLFQPERYDYCSPLLAIGRQPEKRCGGSRQWFRAASRAPTAGLPRRVEGARLQAVGRGKHRDPAGLAWSAICRTVWHGSTAGSTLAPSYIPYYNRRPVLTCTASRRGGGIWYRLNASGRVYALQRVASCIISACIGLVSWAVNRVQSQEKPL